MDNFLSGEFLSLLRRIDRFLFGKRKVISYFSKVRYSNGVTITGDIKEASMKEGQYIDLKLAFTTKNGHPAKHQEGSVVWEVTDPSVFLEDVPGKEGDETEKRAICSDGSVDKVVNVNTKADGDPDDNEEDLLLASIAIPVTQGDAKVATLTATEPQDLPVDETPVGEGSPANPADTGTGDGAGTPTDGGAGGGEPVTE